MNHCKAFEEMVDTIQKYEQCVVFLSDGDEISICPATDFIGGSKGYYMCDVLGNVQYDSVEEICEKVLNFIGDRVIENIEVDW